MTDELTVIGLMSGTSMDGVDAAILKTNGVQVTGRGSTFSLSYSPDERAVLRQAVEEARFWTQDMDRPAVLDEAEAIVTRRHIEAVAGLLQFQRGKVDLIGFHGQTVLHRPERRWTVQLGDCAAMAAEFGIPVVGDFRQADVAAGGQGAPFAPLYHRALIRSLPEDAAPAMGPAVVVNMGGVGNVTYIDRETVLAFDTGPANGPVDDWVAAHTSQSYDKGGAIAAKGRVKEDRIREALLHPYFAQDPPKSLDRLDFTMELAGGLSVEDGAATLTAFSAICVAQARAHFPAEPVAWIVCGGGRHNPTLMMMISAAVPAIVYSAEDMGWRGDHLEAEAFAFLAARSVKGMPLSLPTTTGVPGAMPGGVLYEVEKAARRK